MAEEAVVATEGLGAATVEGAAVATTEGMAEEAAAATEGKVVVTAADLGRRGRCVEWRADAGTSTSRRVVGARTRRHRIRPPLYAYPAPVQLVLSA